MSAAVHAASAPRAPKPGPALLAFAERGMLALRITLAMAASGLLLLAVLWQAVFPAERMLSDLVAGGRRFAGRHAGDRLRLAQPAPSQPAWRDRPADLGGAGGRLGRRRPDDRGGAADHHDRRPRAGGAQPARLARGDPGAGPADGDAHAAPAEPDGSAETVATADLRPGDRIELLAGGRVPVDGVVRAGDASLDMASLTGESVPVDVGVGDTALAGSINTDGRLELEVVRLGADTTLGKIIALMRTAERAKPPVARLLERYAGHYTALVLMVAAGTWFGTGDTAATLAVLVASCPCALVLAAPATAVAAISVAARHGILIKGAAFLEQLAEVTSVVFDKTGTLTTGELALSGFRASPGVEEGAALRLAAALGAASSHPVSRAVSRAAPPGTRPALDRVRELGGFGVTATVDGQAAALGRPDLFAGLGVEAPAPPAHDGPIAGLSHGGAFLGWLLFADRTRAEARAAVEELRALGLGRQVLLTGDRDAVARRIGAELGIADVVAGALPEQKMGRVLAEIRGGFRPLVVGDGINDSLALKAGAVGVAMGAQGTDVALASADLVLMTSDLRRLATAIRLSRRCRRTIHVNVAIGLGWTLALVGLAAAGVLGTEGAVIAALLHNLSTFLGLGNAGRLLLFNEAGPGTPGPAPDAALPMPA